MIVDFFFRHFFGFSMQIVPGVLLLLLPFDRTRYRVRAPMQWMIFTFAALLLSGVYAFLATSAYSGNQQSESTGYLFGNIFMLVSILVIVTLYFLLIVDRPLHKLLVFFGVVTFASIQYSLVNVLLDFTPTPPASQIGQAYDRNTCFVYLIVTAILLPPAALFFRRTLRTYLKSIRSDYSRWELVILILTTALYLAINALFSMFWAQFRERFQINQSYYMPVILLLTAMLALVYYSIIKLANLRSEEAEQKMEAAVIRMDHDRISRDIENQRERLHDTRQLLRTLYMLAKSGDMDALQAYYDETVEHIHITDERFCTDNCMNGILRYYDSLASSAGMSFHAQARCANLSGIAETDLTVLMGNALENAISAARAYRSACPERPSEISLAAEETQNLLCVQLENACDQVVYSANLNSVSKGDFLAADAFVSTNGTGHGLRRMETIARKYDGTAVFRYDEETHTFITRLTLVIPR